MRRWHTVSSPGRCQTCKNRGRSVVVELPRYHAGEDFNTSKAASSHLLVIVIFDIKSSHKSADTDPTCNLPWETECAQSRDPASSPDPMMMFWVWFSKARDAELFHSQCCNRRTREIRKVTFKTASPPASTQISNRGSFWTPLLELGLTWCLRMASWKQRTS